MLFWLILYFKTIGTKILQTNLNLKKKLNLKNRKYQNSENPFDIT